MLLVTNQMEIVTACYGMEEVALLLPGIIVPWKNYDDNISGDETWKRVNGNKSSTSVACIHNAYTMFNDQALYLSVIFLCQSIKELYMTKFVSDTYISI